MLSGLLFDVIEISLSTSAVILLLFFLSPVINKKYTAKWRYGVWLFLFIRLLIPLHLRISPPIVNLPAPVKSGNIPSLPDYLNNTVTSIPVQSNAEFHIQPQGTPLQYIPYSPAIDVWGILSTIWIIGILLFIAYHFIGYFLFRKEVLRWSDSVKNKEINTIFFHILKELNIRKSILLKKSIKVSSPMMTGFFKPILLIPSENYKIDDYQFILKHELIHYKHHDIWNKLLITCTNAVHWFNPIIYLAAYKANQDIESSCDEEIVKNHSLEFCKQYSKSTLSVIHSNNIRKVTFSTFYDGGKKAMRQRFENILDRSPKRPGIIVLCAIVLATCLTSTFVVFADKKPEEPQMQIFSMNEQDKNNAYQCLKDSVYKNYKYYKDLSLDQNTLTTCSNIEKYYKDYWTNGIVDGKKVAIFSHDYDFTILLAENNVKDTKKGIFCGKTDKQQYDFYEIDFSDPKRSTINRIAAITPEQSKYFSLSYEAWKFKNQRTQEIANCLGVDLTKYQRVTSNASPKYMQYKLYTLGEMHSHKFDDIDKGPFELHPDDTRPEFFLNREETGGIILKQNEGGTCYQYTYDIIDRPGNINGNALKVTGVKSVPGKYISYEDYQKTISEPTI